MQLVVFAIVLAAVAIFLLPKVPHAQRVRLHLGVGSSSIVAVTARVGALGAAGVWDREATWRFPEGAPPSIEWTFELPDGAAAIEVELTKASGGATLAPQVNVVDLHADHADRSEDAQIHLRLE